MDITVWRGEKKEGSLVALGTFAQKYRTYLEHTDSVP